MMTVFCFALFLLAVVESLPYYDDHAEYDLREAVYDSFRREPVYNRQVNNAFDESLLDSRDEGAVDGGWGEWEVGKCTPNGQSWRRYCIHPRPKNGGKLCVDDQGIEYSYIQREKLPCGFCISATDKGNNDTCKDLYRYCNRKYSKKGSMARYLCQRTCFCKE